MSSLSGIKLSTVNRLELKCYTQDGVKTNLQKTLEEGRSLMVEKDGKYSVVNLHHFKQNELGALNNAINDIFGGKSIPRVDPKTGKQKVFGEMLENG